MSLFRSEEHVNRWLKKTGNTRGAVVALERVWKLSTAWYQDPRNPNWRIRTRDESQEILASVGLTGEFWELPRPK
jgi:hypothetical protein